MKNIFTAPITGNAPLPPIAFRQPAPAAEGIMKAFSLREKVGLYCAGRGLYSINFARARQSPLIRKHATPSLFSEDGQSCNDRARDDGYFTLSSMQLSHESIKSAVEQLVKGGLGQSLAAEFIITPKVTWTFPDVRAFAVRQLAELKLGKPLSQASPEEIRHAATHFICNDFRSNGLGGLLWLYYENSPFKAVSAAFPELGILAWQMWKTPSNFFNKKAHRVQGVKWLVEQKLGKKLALAKRNEARSAIKQLCCDDFLNNGQEEVLRFHGHMYKAVQEAFPRFKINPWELSTTTPDFFEDAAHRRQAFCWLLEKKMRKPLAKVAPDKLRRTLTLLGKHDFHDYGLPALLDHYSGSPFKAVSGNFPELKLREWEMRMTPQGFFDALENRVSAVKWLAELKHGKPLEQASPEELRSAATHLTTGDFRKNNLGGLLWDYYGNSPFKAVSAAFPGLALREWEMHKTPSGFFYNASNRFEAVIWLAARTLGAQDASGLPPELLREAVACLNYTDFRAHGLNGIQNRRGMTYDQAVEEALSRLAA